MSINADTDELRGIAKRELRIVANGPLLGIRIVFHFEKLLEKRCNRLGVAACYERRIDCSDRRGADQASEDPFRFQMIILIGRSLADEDNAMMRQCHRSGIRPAANLDTVVWMCRVEIK